MELIDRFIDFESEMDMFNKKLNKFSYWQYIRIEVYNKILTKSESIGLGQVNAEKLSNMSRLKSRIENIIMNPLKTTFFLKEKELLVLNHQRRVRNAKYYYCLYTDKILESLDKSYYVFEQSFVEKHYKPIPTKNIKYFDALNMYADIIIQIKLRNRKKYDFIKKNEKQEVREVQNKIYSEFGLEIDLLDTIVKLKIKYDVYSKYYRKLLKRISPKIILEVVYYSAHNLIINSVARELGISIIELQHGTMGKYHIAYNFGDIKKTDVFPDYLFLFGRYWKESTRFPIESSRIRVVGWPYFEEKVNLYKKRTKENKKLNILFISQGTIGKELSLIAAKISGEIDMNKYEITYKLHPGEYDRWKSEYPWLIENNIKVVDDNLNDMHYYFSNADIQVGVYSTAIIEGVGYGLKTFILKAYGHKYFEYLYSEGYFQLFDNHEELLSYLEFAHSVEDDSSFMKYLWEPDSLNNILSEIDELHHKGRENNE